MAESFSFRQNMAESVQDQDLSHAIFQVVWNDDGSTKVLPQRSQNPANELEDIPMVSEHIHGEKFHRMKDLDVEIGTIEPSENFHVQGVVEAENQIVTEITYHETTDNPKGKKRPKSHVKIKEEKDPDSEITQVKREKKDMPAIRKRFSRNWFNLPEFSKWLEESPIPGYAYCNICKKDLLPGKSELLKHACTAKHTKKMEALSSLSTTTEGEITQRIVDLRSDTVTTPTAEMREAMKKAVVGDDAFGEDPTTNELKRKVAVLLGKEEALFVTSGTMANLIAVLTHCWSRGSLVILGDQSYMYRASQGGISEFGSISQRVVRNEEDGTFQIPELREILKSHNASWPTSTLVSIENTHTMMGGRALPIKWLDALGEVCNCYGIPIHMDGARLVNASAAIGSSPARLAKHCSSVTFCLNKGLGAPVGSVLVGSAEFIARASVIRKTLGGTMHQSGVLAAAGLYGLNNFIPRISKDHANARGIAKAVCNANAGCITVDMKNIQTNVVMLICDNIRVNPQQLVERLEMVTSGEEVELSERTIIKSEAMSSTCVRLMTHGDLLMEDIRAVVRKLNYVVSEYENCYVIEYM